MKEHPGHVVLWMNRFTKKGESKHMPLFNKVGISISLRRSSYPLLLALVMSVFLAIPSAAYAHPPSNVSLAYDGQKHVLAVTITHSSFFPSKHYIKNVEISLNGKVITSVPYTSQPTGDTFTYTYPVSALPGNELSVTAACNIFGSLQGKLTVQK
jgi:hypothetical protein